jgi:hypothetical protein
MGRGDIDDGKDRYGRERRDRLEVDGDRNKDRDRRKRRSRSRSRDRSKRRRDESSDSDSDRGRRGGDENKDKKKKSKKMKKSSSRRKREVSSSDSDSSGSSSGADSDSSTELLVRLEKERKALKVKRRAEKERIKSTETLEEKRQRRLIKKELKDMRRRKEKEGGTWGDDEEYSKYTNDDNPFGDPNLTQSFRWQKKLQADGMDKISEKELDKFQRRKQDEQREELQKVKTARLAREKEREERQELLDMEQRSRDNEKFSKWQQQEDEFHLEQAKLRSKIRIQDGRAKPIDLLAKYVSAEDDVDAIEMHEPYTYLNGLTIGDLEDLLADINVYNDIDLEKNNDFWADIVVIVEDELSKLKKLDARSQYELASERRQGINKAVADDVQDVFKGKTAEQLDLLQRNIESKLSQRSEGVDVSYWESLLSQLKAHLARARLRDKHKDNLKQKLELLKAEQGGGKGGSGDGNTREGSPVPGPSGEEIKSEKEEEEVEEEEREKEEEDQFVTPALKNAPAAEKKDKSVVDFERGGYSPVYVSQDNLEPGVIVIEEFEDDGKRQEDQRRAMRGVKIDNVLNAEEKALEREAKKGMTDEEASFAVESALEQTYEWSDKYRPRKPRYFNRVHTGFEWNKYNQTHYDIDNPPPKVVQGYKFNIFFPDLIDKAKTPTYTLTPCADNSDFAVLRITASPPYEDIAFKIVNREWEFGYKRGFKCQFHNNIFQMWFHFKRLRYRR